MNSSNNTMGVIYRVVGRYMAGSTVTSYHLVGSDGSQVHVTKDRLVYMIVKGLVENMRVQASGSEMILRGKGINLNKLPIYDEKKQEFRGNEASQGAASTNVAPKRGSGVNPMGQLKITKRILYKTSCLGYMVVDFSGKEMKLSREKVIDLARERLISNATVQRYNEPGVSKPKLILRGAGCDLTELPVLIVDETGNIIDPTLDKGNIRVRATRMRRGGILRNSCNGKSITFDNGDYLICGLNGDIKALEEDTMRHKFIVDKTTSTAICDNYLDNLNGYTIEIFGTEEREIKAEQISKWAIVRETKQECLTE